VNTSKQYGILRLYLWSVLRCGLGLVLLPVPALAWSPGGTNCDWRVTESDFSQYPARATNWWRGFQYAPGGWGNTTGLLYPGYAFRHDRTNGLPSVLNSRGHIVHGYDGSFQNPGIETVDGVTYNHTNQWTPAQYPNDPLILFPGWNYNYRVAPCAFFLYVASTITNVYQYYWTNWPGYPIQGPATTTHIRVYPFPGTNFGEITLAQGYASWCGLASNWYRMRVWVGETNEWDLTAVRLTVHVQCTIQQTNGGGYVYCNDNWEFLPEVGDLSFWCPVGYRRTNGLPWVTYIHPYDNPGTNISFAGPE